jgi:hypothetical protein
MNMLGQLKPPLHMAGSRCIRAARLLVRVEFNDTRIQRARPAVYAWRNAGAYHEASWR